MENDFSSKNIIQKSLINLFCHFVLESGFSMLVSCRDRLKDVCVRVSRDVLDSVPELQPEKLKAKCEKYLNVKNVTITICRGELS